MVEKRIEEDYPPGHPARFDYDPQSLEAVEWARKNVYPLGERDFPVDHPGAVDTPGNKTGVMWTAGVDPFNPHREAFTGRTPEQAAGVAALTAAASKAAKESPVMEPVDAMVLAEMMNNKRAQLKRDVLTADEYTEVLAEYHRTRGE